MRLSGFMVALFTLILIFQNTMINQQRLPFDTTEQFELNISKSVRSKIDMISDLNSLTESNHGVLVKVVTDSENYENKKDILWFGTEKPYSRNLIIEEEKIHWIDPKLEGKLISSNETGSRPLYGTYSFKGSELFKEKITNWANENGITISWLIQPPIIKTIYNSFIHNGVGNAMMTAFLLYAATMIAWFVSHAKSRTIRLLGGIGNRRIHLEDVMTVIWITCSGFLAAALVMIGYIAYVDGIRQLLLLIIRFLITILFLLIAVAVCGIIISLLVKPKTECLAERKIPLKRFRQLGTVTRVLSMMIALIIIPSTIDSAYILQQLSKEYSFWQNMQQNVSVSFGDIESLFSDKMLPHVSKLFEEMELQNAVSISLVIDKSILLSKDEYGGYDHIIITDRAWIDTFKVGIENEESGGTLTEVKFENISAPLQDFLSAQMPLWTKAEEVQPIGVKFYEFIGEKFLALPANVGYGGSTIQTQNPFVILVDNPIETLQTEGFLLPAASSGNVVFSDEDKLSVTLAESPVSEYVVSIDTIADVALEQAQKFGKEAAFYFLACVLIFIAMMFAGIMEAQLWAGSNKKRIFTLHTFGNTYSKIISTSFIKEMLIAFFTIFLGAGISFIVKRPPIIVLVSVAGGIAVLYGVGSYIAYQRCVRKSFHQISSRND